MPDALTPEQTAPLNAELVLLNAKLASRSDQAGFARNTQAIRARLSEIEAQLTTEPTA